MLNYDKPRILDALEKNTLPLQLTLGVIHNW